MYVRCERALNIHWKWIGFFISMYLSVVGCSCVCMCSYVVCHVQQYHGPFALRLLRFQISLNVPWIYFAYSQIFRCLCTVYNVHHTASHPAIHSFIQSNNFSIYIIFMYMQSTKIWMSMCFYCSCKSKWRMNAFPKGVTLNFLVAAFFFLFTIFFSSLLNFYSNWFFLSLVCFNFHWMWIYFRCRKNDIFRDDDN